MDLCLLLLLVVFLGDCASVQSELCAGNGCQCTGSVKIDLNGFFDYPVTKIPDPSTAQYLYSFSPCTPMTCKTGEAETAALCQFDSTKPSAAVSLGGVQNISWSVTSKDEFTLTITGGDQAFSPNRGRQSTVKFHFTNDSSASNKINYVGEDTPSDKTKPLTYMFEVTFSRTNVDAGAGSVVGIVGIVLIVLFIVGVATYFIVGGLVMYFHKGARGVEVIPNYTFWKDLPVLVKDGFLFTISPCRQVYADKKGYQAL